jgi:hypothetical protein
LSAIGGVDPQDRRHEPRSVVDPPERDPLAVTGPQVLARGAKEDGDRERGVVEVLRVPLPVGVAVDTHDRPVSRGQEHRAHGPVELLVLIEQPGVGVAEALSSSGEQGPPDDRGADVAFVVDAAVTALAVVGQDPAHRCYECPARPAAGRCFAQDDRGPLIRHERGARDLIDPVGVRAGTGPGGVAGHPG